MWHVTFHVGDIPTGRIASEIWMRIHSLLSFSTAVENSIQQE